MTKLEADGQTAMTPALAFCLGLANAWHHDLNQMYNITNIELLLQMVYQMLASVKPNNNSNINNQKLFFKN
jgi:hypothetical protein